MDKHLETLEFNEIRTRLCTYAMTEHARQKINALLPITVETQLRHAQNETDGARKILDLCGLAPLPDTAALREILTRADKGAQLLPDELLTAASFTAACRRLIAYLKKAEPTGSPLAFYGTLLTPLEELTLDIHRAITGTGIDSNATKALSDIRRRLQNAHAQLTEKMEALLKANKKYCTDNFISKKNGCYTLPVARAYKNQILGTVVAESSAGTTCFIEPTAARKQRERIGLIETEESIECDKILYTLSAMVSENGDALRQNMDTVEALDFAFAKGRLSAELNCTAPEITLERRIRITRGRHPLLNPDIVVPIDFSVGEPIRGVVITGPNTGGKTVALKLVGLFSVMAQCGLHLPCESAEICMNSRVLCDIGDRQDIAQNLSTFSAHITNVTEILRETGRDTLVLLDELGSGTDPSEGMGIAVAILESLRLSGCLFLATTHYAEVKQYAESAVGVQNARMTFDRETLQPKYRLVLGEAGESCAFYIAERLGFPAALIEYARGVTYGRADTSQSNFAFRPLQSAPPAAKSTLQKKPREKAVPARALQFGVGDAVVVYPGKKIGIVYRPADEAGTLVVQVQGKKLRVPHKRVKIQNKAESLYPPDYDFSILFDSVETRKAHHKMDKGHIGISADISENIEDA